MPYGLTDKQLEEITNVLASNNKLEEAILFGSRAKGNYKPGSDIDVALKGEGLTLNDLLHLAIQFEDGYLPYTFDLVLYKNINNPELVSHIDRVGVSIYKKAIVSNKVNGSQSE